MSFVIKLCYQALLSEWPTNTACDAVSPTNYIYLCDLVDWSSAAALSLSLFDMGKSAGTIVNECSVVWGNCLPSLIVDIIV